MHPQLICRFFGITAPHISRPKTYCLFQGPNGLCYGKEPGTRKLNYTTTSLDYPTLKTVNGYTVRIFLQKYDQYAKKVQARHVQLIRADPDDFSTEPSCPVPLKFRVDNQWVRSAIDLGRIKSNRKPVTHYDELEDTTLREYLEGTAEAEKETMATASLDKIAAKSLRMEMHDDSAVSRMDELFIAYHALLSEHGLTVILQDNQKDAVGHVLSKIRPQRLQTRLETDFKFSHIHLRKNFEGFFSNAQRLSEAFELLDDSDYQTNFTPKHKKRKKIQI